MTRHLRTLLLGIVMAGCGGGGGGTQVDATPASITVVTGNNQTGSAGAALSAPIQVRVFNAQSQPIPNIAVTLSITAGGGSVATTTVTTDANGIATIPNWTLGSGEGTNQLKATAGSVSVTISATGQVSPFVIELRYLTAASPAQMAAFEAARFRWRQIIRSELPDSRVVANAGDCTQSGTTPPSPAMDETIDDLVIFVRLRPIDGPNNVLGSAGPCFVRNSTVLPVVGIMDFDTADLDTLEARGQLNNVILHEMGHVLGFGSIWTDKNLLDTTTTDFNFKGTNAIAAFNSSSGSGYTGRKVPVETTGGSGTAKAHWRENGRGGLGNELMTGFLNGGTNPLSIISIQSMVDLGYTVDQTKADAYTVPILSQTLKDDRGSVFAPALRLVDGERPLTVPVKFIERSGTVVRRVMR